MKLWWGGAQNHSLKPAVQRAFIDHPIKTASTRTANRCTGFTGCLLALCQGLQRRCCSVYQNSLSLMNEQSNTVMRFLIIWFTKLLNEHQDWNHINTLVNISLLHFIEMLQQVSNCFLDSYDDSLAYTVSLDFRIDFIRLWFTDDLNVNNPARNKSWRTTPRPHSRCSCGWGKKKFQ